LKQNFLSVLMCLIVIVLCNGSLSAELEDPTGALLQIQQLNEAHRLEVESIVANVTLNHHPEFGTILPDAYPVNSDGTSPEDILEQFVQELEGNGYVITQLTQTQNTLSGNVLVEHLIGGEQVFVWHQLSNAPVTVINATAMLEGLCYRLVRVWIRTCTNGAGYWDWQYILVPCDMYNYTVNYYSNQAQLSPYPLHAWPTPPPIDPTGTFQRIHDLNVAHRAQVDAILNGVALDEHPVYGCVTADDYPVNPDGMTLEDANEFIIEQTAGVELLDSSVEELAISGRIVSEHMINGQQEWVWHEYDQTPMICGTALVRTNNTSALDVTGGSGGSATGPKKCYELRWVWTPPCTNKQVPGYWSWKYVEVPCPGIETPALGIDYSMGLGVLVYDL